MSIPTRLRELGIVLPATPKPVAAYVPVVRTAGGMFFVSGQVPFRDGQIPPEFLGPVPSKVNLETAQRAARQCTLNALAVLNSSLDGGPDGRGLHRITRIVRLGVFVCCDPGFTDQPKVANGASELLVDIFGDSRNPDRGRHARAAVGSIALPLGACVEVEMVAEAG